MGQCSTETMEDRRPSRKLSGWFGLAKSQATKPDDLSSVPIKPRWKQRGNSCQLCSVAAHTHARAHTCTHNAKVLKEMTVLWILCSDIFPLKNKDEIKTFLLRQKHAASHHRLSIVKHPTTLDSSTQEVKAGGLSSK